MKKSYIMWYRLRSFLMVTTSFLIFSMFLTTLLISRKFVASTTMNHNIQKRILKTTSQISSVDGYFLQVYLNLSDQQIKELQLLYSKHINCVVLNPEIRYWHWLNFVEKIRVILTPQQREIFEKILQKIKYH